MKKLGDDLDGFYLMNKFLLFGTAITDDEFRLLLHWLRQPEEDDEEEDEELDYGIFIGEGS